MQLVESRIFRGFGSGRGLTTITILGLVLGGMLEQNFVTSMIKADGAPGAFFARPIAGVLGVATILVWLASLIMRAKRRRREA